MPIIWLSSELEVIIEQSSGRTPSFIGSVGFYRKARNFNIL